MAPLPFDQTADVLDQGNAVQRAGVAVHTERLSSPRATATGEAYNWIGQAELSARDVLVRKSNRTLVVDGQRLKVISATAHEYLPHVALELREHRAGGGA